MSNSKNTQILRLQKELQNLRSIYNQQIVLKEKLESDIGSKNKTIDDMKSIMTKIKYIDVDSAYNLYPFNSRLDSSVLKFYFDGKITINSAVWNFSEITLTANNIKYLDNSATAKYAPFIEKDVLTLLTLEQLEFIDTSMYFKANKQILQYISVSSYKEDRDDSMSKESIKHAYVLRYNEVEVGYIINEQIFLQEDEDENQMNPVSYVKCYFILKN